MQAVAQQALPLRFLGGSFRLADGPYAGRVGSRGVITRYNINREEADRENNQQVTPQEANARARIIFWPRHLESVAL